jgi:hypothetical protein
MRGTFVEDGTSRGEGLVEIEDLIMRNIMVNERVLATAKAMKNPDEAKAALARIVQGKAFLLAFYVYAGVRVEPDMKRWLKAMPTMNDYEYLGEWCPFWYEWKNNLDFNADKLEWRCPLSHPNQLLLYHIFGDHCSDCMYAYYGEFGAFCLCGVKDDLYEAVNCPACSHFKNDEHMLEGSDMSDDSLETCKREMGEQNERRVRAWRDEGRPKFPPEDTKVPMEDDPRVVATLKRFGVSRKPLREEDDR